jgi:energy-coupling factor transport system ATP-binding protein
MAEPVIEIRNLYWKYPNMSEKSTLFKIENLNLKIFRNEFFGITGATGSGKSTICQIIAGLIPHQIKLPEDKLTEYFRGEVYVLGELVSALEKKENSYMIIGKGSMAPEVGLVMQDPESQFLTMSALSEITLGLQIIGLPKEEIMRRVKESLSIVGLDDLYPILDKLHPSELSGGQKQRLIIASFIAMRPKILILDEPTSDLDSAGKIEIIEAIANLKKIGDITVILVEHDPEILKRFTDRVAVLSEGNIIAIDSPENIFSNKDLRKYVEVSELESIIESDEDFLKKIDADAARSFKPKRNEINLGEVAIEVKDLFYEYPDGALALNGIDMNIKKGEFVALIGQNGSGKSTFSKVISGYLTGWKGMVKILGEDISNKRIRERIPAIVGYVFQNPDHQIFNRRVDSEIEYGLWNIGIKEEEIKKRVDETLARVGLLRKRDEDPLFLSRGEKRRLALASVIAMKPQILIVDEPTTGQDYRMSKEIMEILMEMNREGSTIIVITHDMRLVAEYCRRVIVMKRGKIIFDGKPENLFENEELLKESSLIAPREVQLSKKLKETGIMQDLLLSAREWLEFLKFENEKKRYVLLTFEAMKKHSKNLSREIISKAGKPDAIVYIERGGMVIGRLMSDYLGVKDLYGIKASYYTEDGIPSTHVSVGEISINIPINNYILLVDDIADTGKTIEAVMEKLKKITQNIKVCTIAYKPHSSIKPDFYSYIVDNDTWVVFEYEEQETRRSFEKRNNEIGLKFIEEKFGR